MPGPEHRHVGLKGREREQCYGIQGRKLGSHPSESLGNDLSGTFFFLHGKDSLPVPVLSGGKTITLASNQSP